MFTLITTKTTGRTGLPVAACLGVSRLRGTGVSFAGLPAAARTNGFALVDERVFDGKRPSADERLFANERPTRASVAVAAAQVETPADVAAAADAGTGLAMASQTTRTTGIACATGIAGAAAAISTTKQYRTTKHHSMWAFRGPEPWRDPA
ncbi:hypothetical protein [Streptomyces durbertensis]|nr:hypothetical protein [Streptomyces durbertensis]